MANSADDSGTLLPPPPGVEIATTQPVPPPDVIGDPVNPLDVHVGECINQYSWTEDDDRVEVTTLVPCDGPHDREVYFESNFPAEAGAPYPGPEPIEEYARQTCYDAFAPFVGVAYEVSDLEIAFTIPPEENFVDPAARYRGVVCYLYDPDGATLTGTARNTAR